MTIRVFYNRTRPSAPWCIQYDGRLDREAHFESRQRAEVVARSQGWRPPLPESLADSLAELAGLDPDEIATALLDRFNITEKDTTT